MRSLSLYFPFNITYSGSSFYPIRCELWQDDSSSGYPMDIVESEGEGVNAYLSLDCSRLGKYYVVYFLDKNNNNSRDWGEPSKESEYFIVKDYSIQYVNYAIHNELELGVSLSEILAKASLHLHTKEKLLACPDYPDYRVAVKFYHDGQIGNFDDDEFLQIRYFVDLDSLRINTSGYTFRVIEGFWLNIEPREENLNDMNSSLHGLTLTGYSNTSVLTWNYARQLNQYALWVHEYVHQLQSLFGFRHNNMCIQYYMHESASTNIIGVYSNTRDLLEAY